MDVDTYRSPLRGSKPREVMERDLIELVEAARQGDGKAWNALVREYAPLVTSVTRQFRLSPSDAEDVGQVVWLRFFENLARVRTICAIPGWIKTTTRNEALRVLRARWRLDLIDPTILVGMNLHVPDQDVDRDLLRRERDQAIRDGLAELEPSHRELLILLHSEDRPSYQEVSETLGMRHGSIGPTRARCLERLRKTEAVRRFNRSGGDPLDIAAA